jgi:hypothetical protein
MGLALAREEADSMRFHSSAFAHGASEGGRGCSPLASIAREAPTKEGVAADGDGCSEG